jgi:hypothetical protein
VKSPVAVEKLTAGKTLEKTLRWDALQTTFASRADIFYLQISGYFEQNGLFQQPRLFSTVWDCGV